MKMDVRDHITWQAAAAIPEHLRGVITTRRYTNPRLPYLTLPYAGNMMLAVLSLLVNLYKSTQKNKVTVLNRYIQRQQM